MKNEDIDKNKESTDKVKDKDQAISNFAQIIMKPFDALFNFQQKSNESLFNLQTKSNEQIFNG